MAIITETVVSVAVPAQRVGVSVTDGKLSAHVDLMGVVNLTFTGVAKEGAKRANSNDFKVSLADLKALVDAIGARQG